MYKHRNWDVGSNKKKKLGCENYWASHYPI